MARCQAGLTASLVQKGSNKRQNQSNCLYVQATVAVAIGLSHMHFREDSYFCGWM